MYDSFDDSTEHIRRVQVRYDELIAEAQRRRNAHDLSKFVEPEKSQIDAVRPALKQLAFGSEEYKKLKYDSFGKLHFAANDHHIQHHTNGLWDMTLPQLEEMIADWKAATETNGPDDNIIASIRIIFDEQDNGDGDTNILRQIFLNTVFAMGWNR